MSGGGDFRRHAKWCRRGAPPAGTRRLDVFPDYGAFPVWEGGMVGPAALGISARLADQLQAWQDFWETCADSGREEPDMDGIGVGTHWDRRGRVLAERLEAETGAVVVYSWPLGPYGGDPWCLRCGRHTRAARTALDEWLVQLRARLQETAD